MSRTLPVLLLIGVLISVSGYAEVKEWYYPIVLFDNGTNRAGNGEEMIIYPCKIDGLKGGETLPLCVKENGAWKPVGECYIIWTDEWEAKARIKLASGVTFIILQETFCRWTADIDKAFEHWWKKGVDWEKEKNYYYAFRAYFRALIYRPNEPQVDAAYRRSGFLDYVTQAEAAFKAGKYRAAISKYKQALAFSYPGWDPSVVNSGIKKCEEMLGKSNDFEELVSSAERALAMKNYAEALRLGRVIWLSSALPYGTPEERDRVRKVISASLPRVWSALKSDFDKLMSSKKSSEAWRKLIRFARYAALGEGFDAKAYETLLEKAEKALPADCAERMISDGLKKLASCQTEAGYFRVGNEEAPDGRSAVLTGIALATFAACGNTSKIGPHKAVVAKAVGWIGTVRKDDSALFDSKDTTAHLALAFGISELVVASGDENYGGTLRGALEFASFRLTPDGRFAFASSKDPMFEDMIAAIAAGNGAQVGIIAPLNMTDILRDGVFARVDPAKGSIRGWQGADVTGPEADAVATGTNLAILRGSGANFVGKLAIFLIKKTIELQPSSFTGRPDALYAGLWGLNAFPVDDWAPFSASVSESCTTIAISSEDSLKPTPNSAVELYGNRTCVSFAVLAARYALGID